MGNTKISLVNGRNIISRTQRYLLAMASCLWIIVTGGGTGIGRAIVKHFSETHKILTCGRRLEPLEETKASSCNPSNVQIVQADIAQDSDRQKLIARLPPDAGVALLVQNAAIGDPDRLPDVDLRGSQPSRGLPHLRSYKDGFPPPLPTDKR